MTEPRFKLLRGIRRNSEVDIKKQLPEGAEILSATTQSNLPNTIAVIYSVPDKKHARVRKPSDVSKPHSINKPRIDAP
jgi:hypothetical protein